MSLASQISPWLLQAGTLPDTIVTIPVRAWYDLTNGILQLIVLVLAVAVLGAMALMLLTLRKTLDAGKGMVEKFYADARPIIEQANLVAGDAREVVAMLRTDVERITNAAGAVSEQLLDVAGAMENRLDEVSAVIDVIQEELEETALTATAALRGARLGGRALAGGIGKALMSATNPKQNRQRRDLRDEDAGAYERGGSRDREPERPRTRRDRDAERNRERRYRDNA